LVTSVNEAIFRLIDKKRPTLLFDEAEMLKGNSERAEAIRSIFEFDTAHGELQSALQEHCDYLESVSADYLLASPAIRKRVTRLHETLAA
jgi:hypothetical protein